MAGPSYTYTLTNGTAADADEVMQNFNDIKNGVTDGTKDLSIAALTCSGNASFNGNVTLGNGSGDDVTITGSIAASIAIKTQRTYDIGSADLGLAILYLGGNSTYTIALQAPSSGMSADYSLTLPASGGTANYAMTTNGSGTASWTAWSTSSWAATTSALGTVYWPNSHVRSDTGNGHGSSSTKIRRITNSTTTGSGITAATSSTLGNTYTIAQPGIYFVRYSDGYASITAGISVNSASLTTSIGSLAASEIMGIFFATAGQWGSCSGMRIMAANDVIRPHTDGSPNETTSSGTQFEICQAFRFS